MNSTRAQHPLRFHAAVPKLWDVGAAMAVSFLVMHTACRFITNQQVYKKNGGGGGISDLCFQKAFMVKDTPN